jgi:uncharacterized protein YkwD
MTAGAALMSACGTASGASSTTAVLPTAVIATRPPPAPIVAAPRALPAPQPRALELPTQAPVVPPTPAVTSEPSAPGAATPAPPRDPALLEALLVAEINRVRAANGLPAYQHSPELSAAARAHSCDLAAHGVISHTSSDGRTLPDRLAGSSPPWEWPSESIAAGLDDPAAIVAMWMDEPPEGWHRRNILDPDQREVGAGYCFAADDPSGNHHYWTADFSRRASAQ